MYNIIIADDEKVIREGLTKLMNWEEIGFNVLDTFSDGVEVIEYVKDIPVDVILTDIKMATISGIEVAKYVYENGIDCKVVFISGHQEFELALQGIKYGVEDYLLKPTNIKNIKETFEKIKNNLDKKNKQLAEEQKNSRRMEEAIPILKNKFFTELIFGGIDSKEHISRQMALLYPQADLTNSFCMVADITINDFEDYMKNVWTYSYDQLEINLINFTNVYEGALTFHLVYKSENIIELFAVAIKRQGQENDLEKVCSDEMISFAYNLSDIFNLNVEWEIKKTFKTIYELIGYRENIRNDRFLSATSMTYMEEKKKLIISNISMGNIRAAHKIFNTLLDELKNSDMQYRNNLVVDLFSGINEMIKGVNSSLADTLKPYFNYSYILSIKSMEDMKDYCDRIFDKIRLAGSKEKNYDTDSLVNKARQYIIEHITKDISQEEVANELFISSSYLSRIFKRQTGETFTQHITKIKMDKAVELLHDPQYKAYQISEYLGYKTTRYFSKLFRVHTGFNPTDYRNNVLNMGVQYEEDR